MKATISLKKLRTDPREYVRLINSGYEVEITEHRKTLTKAVRTKDLSQPKKGNGEAILKAIKELPHIKTPYPEMDTVDLIKKTRLEAYEEDYRRRNKEYDRT